jgi:TPR repeat protein
MGALGRARWPAIIAAAVWLAGCAELMDDLARDDAASGRQATLIEVRTLAENGDSAAQTALGQRYESGNGVAKDLEAAFTWYQRAARGGDPLGQFLLGQMYETGALGAPEFARAAEWYMRAAARGQASAQAGLAKLYEEGRGVEQSFDKAARWYSLAALQWDAADRYPLGAAFATGRTETGATSQREAIKWFQRAAQLGVAEAQFDLGRAHELGHGVGQDAAAAQIWYRQAAEQGHERAAEAFARLSGLAPGATPPEGRVVGQKPPKLQRLPGIGAPLPITPNAAKGGRYIAHLASYRKIEDADTGMGSLLADHGDLLKGLPVEISRVEIPDKGTFFRVQAGPLPSLDAAKALCATLTARKAYCRAMAQES